MLGKKKELNLTTGKIGADLDFATIEAYNLLGTNIDFSFPDKKGCKVIGITSSHPQEGKSYTSINLSYALASGGKKVLLIDGDLRKATTSAILKVNGKEGLTDLLIDGSKPVLYNDILTKNLSFIPSGKSTPRPTDILSSVAFSNFIEGVKKTYDYVMIDFPPINVVSDALAVANKVDGFLYVVRHEFSRRKDIVEGVQKLKFSKANIIGFVYNDYTTSNSYYTKKHGRYYKKYYDNYYSEGYYGYSNEENSEEEVKDKSKDKKTDKK